MKWINVEDGLPDAAGNYLTYSVVGSATPKPYVGTNRFTTRGMPRFMRGDWQRITHWMPLPEPPDKE